jgi:hypothetical protein
LEISLWKALQSHLTDQPDNILWQPAGENQPQQEAYAIAREGRVMQLGYGGQAGGGKTDLALGLASTVFRRSLILRRTSPRLKKTIARGDELFPVRFISGRKSQWRFGGRTIELAHCQYEKDWVNYQGQDQQLIAFDEAAEFTETQVRYISGWQRTVDTHQHTLLLLCFNPPTTPEGEWIVQMFAPWIDPQYPGTKAKPGEVRWFWRDSQDKERECETGEPFTVDGKTIYPISRTFIPASRHDNPYLGEAYERVLDNLPEPLRTMLKEGDFTVTAKPDQWQVIPTAWVLAAMQRGRDTPQPNVALRSVGVDVARGGDNNTVISKLYGTWFAPLVVLPGAVTPDGIEGAIQVSQQLDDVAPIFVDTIGYGASVYDQLQLMGYREAMAVNNSEGVGGTDLSGMYRFKNVRAASYWALREALDPNSGEAIALPDDRDLRVELTAPRYKTGGGRIQLEPKEKISERLGRSPDRADALVLAWWGALNGAILPTRAW